MPATKAKSRSSACSIASSIFSTSTLVLLCRNIKVSFADIEPTAPQIAFQTHLMVTNLMTPCQAARTRPQITRRSTAGRPCQTSIGPDTERRMQIGVKSARVDFGFKQLDDCRCVKALDRIDKVECSRSPLPGCVSHHVPSLPFRDCNLTVLASITDQLSADRIVTRSLQGTIGKRRAASRHPWLVWVERPQTNKAAFRPCEGVPAWLVGTSNKKRFPVPAKTLMVAPLCLQRSNFIHKCQRLDR